MNKEIYCIAMWGSIICSNTSDDGLMSGLWLLLAIVNGVFLIKEAC